MPKIEQPNQLIILLSGTTHTMGTADLHIHSTYSYDATTTVRAILQHASDVGLDVIAVADHDNIRGSLEAMTLLPTIGSTQFLQSKL